MLSKLSDRASSFKIVPQNKISLGGKVSLTYNFTEKYDIAVAYFYNNGATEPYKSISLCSYSDVASYIVASTAYIYVYLLYDIIIGTTLSIADSRSRWSCQIVIGPAYIK